MTHQRHVIREAIVAALAAAGTSAGARVYDHPSDPRAAFPSISVFDEGESQSAETFPGGAGRPILRSYSISVNAEVQQTGQYARARDALCADIEAAIAALSIAGVKSIVPAGFVADQETDGERPISVGRQRFNITYYTTQGNPASSY